MKKDFSLALGGGAARGIAHIGIIRKLEELGQKPVMVSGTSIGAIIAAFYACWYSSHEMEQIAKELKIRKLIDLDLVHGFLKGKKIITFLEKYFWEKEFKDMIIPLKILATNIDTGEKVIFEKGKIIDAIRASISIPSIFTPYKHEHTHLVDGGLVENLPIGLLPREIDTIAVSVQIPIEKRKKREKNFLFPQWTLIGNSYTILRRTMSIMMTQNEIHSLASKPNIILLKPEKSEIDYYDFTKVDELITEGYRVASVLDTYFL